jgi:hypothetical protein
MCQKQVIAVATEQTDDGGLYQAEWQRRLLGAIIKSCHPAFCTQLLQNPAKLWSAI